MLRWRRSSSAGSVKAMTRGLSRRMLDSSGLDLEVGGVRMGRDRTPLSDSDMYKASSKYKYALIGRLSRLSIDLALRPNNIPS